MTGDGSSIAGFEVPLHASLNAPILLAGAPRGLTIVNGTLAAAVGLGLQQWIGGLLLWVAAQSLAVFATRRDPYLAPVLLRHLRQRGYWSC